MTTYKEYKKRIERTTGDVYKIIPRFGTKYEDSRIIKLDPEDVKYHIEEAKKVRELAKIMASKN